MYDSIYYLVTIDFFNADKTEPDTLQHIMIGSCFVNVAERIFKDLADDADVVGIHIEEIGEYPTLDEINKFVKNRK